MGSKNQNETPCNPGKNLNAGIPRQKANANRNSQYRQASEMNPSRQLWKLPDGVIPPLLIPFGNLCRLVLELENDPFHMAVQITPELSRADS